MTVENVISQIDRFLKTADPEVLCIRGNWGTGKTYVWQTAAKKLRDGKDKVALDQYAYVSLFGVNSINQLRTSILQNTLPRAQIGDLVTSETLKTKLDALEGGAKRGLLSMFKVAGEGVFDTVVSGLSVMTSKQIICFDDLERKGADLRAGDVLGYVSYLKEERKCKIVILLNDEALKNDDFDQFNSYLEKVVDFNLKFEPTPEQSAAIALDGADDQVKNLVRERCIKLGIDNVRVIRKIYRLAQEIEPLLKAYKVEVLHSVVTTIVLMAWAHFQPELAPTKQFLTTRSNFYADFVGNRDGKFSATEIKWMQLIREYGYSHTDDFDHALLEGIEDGYFSKEIVERHAEELNQRVKADEAAEKLRTAWRRLQDTFTDTAEESLRQFTACLTENGRFYDLHNVVPIVNLFRDLGRREEGDRLFSAYLESRKGIKGAYDLTDTTIFGNRVDPDIREQVSRFEQGDKPRYDVDELFFRLADDGHDRSITEQLAAVPVREYVRVLKHYTGREFGIIRHALTQYNQLVNPSEAHQTIIRNVGAALEQIARESAFNKFKADGWGIFQKIAWLDQRQATGNTGGQ
ncbi:MAG: hypothetical protein F9K19_23065 [Rhizobiaceae bacterium]|nr:MAG: hypothetical protein F9K19_23065 [Rhizobiaceae bacterium]